MLRLKILVLLISCLLQVQQAIAENKKRVIITQVVSHPSLDAAKNGALSVLDKIPNIEVKTLNAQGDSRIEDQVARKVIADSPDVVISIGTSMTRRLKYFNDMMGKEIPIVFSAVDDPVKAGLVKSLDNGSGNITGVIDRGPLIEQVSLIRQIIPKAKRIAVIYNGGEENSISAIEALEEVVKNLGLELNKKPISHSMELASATRSILAKGDMDALFVTTDNMVASAIESLLLESHRFQVPAISSYGAPVDKGALASLGVDFNDNGKTAGEMAKLVLGGTKAAKLKIVVPRCDELKVNVKTLKYLGINLPKNLIDKAILVD